MIDQAASAAASAAPSPAIQPRDAATVGVVITTYNHARFLEHALASVKAQTTPADDVVVVDDGSTDAPGSIVAGFPGVRLLRQPNRGLAAARNAGLGTLRTSHVVFLDADDRLEPRAIAAGLACFRRVPQSGLVYGGHLYMDVEGELTGSRFEPPGENAYQLLLRGNFIAMHGTVMYRREALLAIGGFDERLDRCEDYDVYLRMARVYRITGYPEFVAAYRMHGANMSGDHRAMLCSALAVHGRHEPAPGDDSRARAAWLNGRQRWRRIYSEAIAEARYRARLDGAPLTATLPVLVQLLRTSPSVALAALAGGVRRRISDLLPGRMRERLLRGREAVPSRGRVRFGDLRRTTPISRSFGYDRGQPIDRLYIERFLQRNAAAIAGDVLEVGDDAYTRRFGGDRVTRRDILHVHSGNPRATLVGDLSDARVLPQGTFDCIIVTQTLQLVYDVRAAITNLHQALAPHGVLLVTAPGISQIDRGEWGPTWFWSFTAVALRRLFAETFGEHAVTVEQYGNVFAATAFLQGLAVEEVPISDLEPVDEAYPVVVAVRARKEGT